MRVEHLDESNTLEMLQFKEDGGTCAVLGQFSERELELRNAEKEEEYYIVKRIYPYK